MCYTHLIDERRTEKLTSQRIQLHRLFNTRDLGGMHTEDGKIVCSGKLYRSGELYAADKDDLEWIHTHVSRVIDFRTSLERNEKPDPQMTDTDAVHLPVMEELAPGITRDRASYAAAFQRIAEDPDAAYWYMADVYRDMILQEHARIQYKKMVSLLLEDVPLGILWHCTAGKDRAGFASVIVETILGISREDILRDYMMTNECRRQENEQMIQGFLRLFADRSAAEKGMRILFCADPVLFQTWYHEAQREFGSMEAYIRDGLMISTEMQQEIRRRYLI